MAYLRINGRPLCEHTGCIAGREQADKVKARYGALLDGCGYDTLAKARNAEAAWRATFPRMTCEAVEGECPVITELCKGRTEDDHE